MKLSENLSDSGVEPETLLIHLRWAVTELRSKDDPAEKKWKFKKEVLIQNTETLIHALERDLMDLED